MSQPPNHPLPEGPHIFVFGSNLAGRHGRGAALHARRHYAARYGIGEGRTGSAYAIPTKTQDLRRRSLIDIRTSVDTFIHYAIHHPEETFYVTRIGCGLAGFTDKQIAPMFLQAPDNCLLPISPQWRPDNA